MAKRKFRVRKGSIKSILLAVLVGALILGSVSGIVAFFNRDTTSVSTLLTFDVGGLDAGGIHTNSTTSIYTKDLIECQGLVIEPDFEAKGTFQVFYYDQAKKFLGSTDVMSAHDGIYKKGSDHPLAKYCRIVITPDPVDENGEYIDEFEIHWYQVAKYAGQYSITVNRDQNFKLKNLFRSDANMINKVYLIPTESESVEEVSRSGYGGTALISVNGVQKLAIICDEDVTVGMYEYYWLDEYGDPLDEGNNAGETETLILEVPEYALHFVCNYKLGQAFIISPIA